MPKKPKPKDTELLDVLIPPLVQAKKDGLTTLEATSLAVGAVRTRWPDMPLKSVRNAVTRLRNI